MPWFVYLARCAISLASMLWIGPVAIAAVLTALLTGKTKDTPKEPPLRGL